MTINVYIEDIELFRSEVSHRPEGDHINKILKGDLIGEVNTMLVNVGKCPDDVITKVFKTQYDHMYGDQTWNINNSVIKEFQIMCNIWVRRILYVQYVDASKYHG